MAKRQRWKRRDWTDATVIGGTVASVDDAGAETATTAADDELELTAEFPPDVHAVTNTSSEVSAASGANRRAENMDNSASQIRTPDGTERAPPPPTVVDEPKDTGTDQLGWCDSEHVGRVARVPLWICTRTAHRHRGL